MPQLYSPGCTKQNPYETPSPISYLETVTGNPYFLRLVWLWQELPHLGGTFSRGVVGFVGGGKKFLDPHPPSRF